MFVTQKETLAFVVPLKDNGTQTYVACCAAIATWFEIVGIIEDVNRDSFSFLFFFFRPYTAFDMEALEGSSNHIFQNVY